jgi:hypothetical protein
LVAETLIGFLAALVWRCHTLDHNTIPLRLPRLDPLTTKVGDGQTKSIPALC